jgi:CRISPR-associated endoribonuclease Cas6
MRIYLKLTTNKETVPFNYQPMLTGSLHKWLGQNNEHEDISLYSFSWLRGAKANKNGLDFKDGATFFISAHKQEMIKKIVDSIQKNPSMDFGFSVYEIILKDDPVFESPKQFYTASPVLIKRNEEGREKHYTFFDTESTRLLTETMANKLTKAGLSAEGLEIAFDKSFRTPKTKTIYYKRIGNKVNVCPVIIKGTPEQIAFAWNVGVGNSTGIGFGALD